MSRFNATIFVPNGTQWQPDGDTILAVFFGTVGIILACLQALFGWWGYRALRALG